MNRPLLLSISFVISCLSFSVAAAQDTPPETDQHAVEYEAMQTDYGYFGTTDAIFSPSETVICTFSLTQNKPKGNKIYPTMLSIWLHADAFSTKSQELIIKQIAKAGSKMVDGQFRHPATLLLGNGEEVSLNFTINNLTEDYTHHSVMLTAPISDPDNTGNSAMYGELATKLRRYDIVSITIANATLSLRLLGLKSSEYINGICRELMLAGCNTASFNTPDSREASDYDVSGFRRMHREKSIDELVFHALGCFPSDIRNIKPTDALQLIADNTEWIVDDDPDFHELEFSQADNYDFTYHGLRLSAEMCWDTPAGSSRTNTDAMVFKGYNYYMQLYSKEKKAVREHYETLCEELEVLGFNLTPHKGEKGDKEPLFAVHDTYRIETCYYKNVHDEYVIQLKVQVNGER